MIRTSSLDASATQFVRTNDFGDYAVLSKGELQCLTEAPENLHLERRRDLEARSLLHNSPRERWSPLEEAAFTTRKSFALDGPSLHIFVVTLRCDHSCQYCQVSRANLDATGFDMSAEHADRAVEIAFESPAPSITIEFQGGEPTIRFDLVRRIVERAKQLSGIVGKDVSFSMVSTLHHLNEDALKFCAEHEISISTSIDGDASTHDANRPLPSRDAWWRTVEGLERARTVLGHDAISALPTVTRRALSNPIGLVDQYRDLGFQSIFLRPISPYGFAKRTRAAIGYTMAEFLNFYDAAFDYILKLNASNIHFEETYAAILLKHILTPFHSGYMDLRSPAGAGLGTLVYNYDGNVYPSDEARMAAKTGDDRFVLGTVYEDFDQLMRSPAMLWLASGFVAEVLPGCKDCAFVPFCGSDPVYHATVNGDPAADRRGTDFCQKHTHLFRKLFKLIDEGNPETMRTIVAWATRRRRDEVPLAGWIDR
jgi:His-Xaa-Ser system radical SAM maturase HxsB